MAWTQADLDALDEAIASGATSVKHGDKTVSYQSIDQMLKARDRIARAIASPRRPVCGFVSPKTGY